MTQPIWFDSTETGAPVLNNAAGSMIALLRAVLINGFNVKAISSISVASGVATVTCPGHDYSSSYGKWLKITGASAPALDGVKQQTIVDANTFTYPAPGVADGSYTATDARRAPLGWTEPHTGTNKAIFARSDPAATAIMVRFDDTHTAPSTATDMRVVMVESATGVDAYTAPSPTDAQISGGQYWGKGSNSATAKQWVLVGDSKRFFFLTQNSASAPPTALAPMNQYFFGDFSTFKAGDAFNTVLFGSNSVTSGSYGSHQMAGSAPPTATDYGGVVARAHGQTGSAVTIATTGLSNISSGLNSNQLPLYPSPVDAGLVMLPGMLLREFSSGDQHPVRGLLKPLVYFFAKYPFAHLQIIDTINNLPGRKVLALASGYSGTAGMFGVDLTGPWD